MKLFFKMRYVPALLFVILAAPVVAHAATSPGLGTAASYSILAGSSVTNSGSTSISGDVGISPGAGLPPNVTGWGSVTLGGTLHDADGAALTAKNDKDTAFGALAVPACGSDGGIDYGAVTHELAGETLVPGVYCANSFHLTNGTLTLNGSASDVWIFKSASDLIITGTSNVVFTGSGLPCNVWWRVVSSASLDAGSSFVGNILSGASITFGTGATLNGRALAGTALVSLLGNTISGPTCTAAPPPPPPP
ncbi:MAG: ice-binding family protein, partial [Patescibacteria group bacterium]